MSIEAIKTRLPEYAKDLKLNLGTLATAAGSLTEQQLWGTLLASALATKSRAIIADVAAEAREHLDAAAQTAVRSAAAIMAMNNIYYRSIHLIGDPQYRQMPARLRMNVIANPGVAKVDFELWALAVSAINGCGMCLESHEKALVQGGMEREAIQQALRVAAVINAVAATLEAEAALSEPVVTV